LHGWEARVYSSLDGASWQEHSSSVLSVNNVTCINIAGRSNGELIMAAIKTNNGSISAARFSNGNWSSFTSQQLQAMFGTTIAAKKQFALIGTGRPSQ